jgi:hypothetical protein
LWDEESGFFFLQVCHHLITLCPVVVHSKLKSERKKSNFIGKPQRNEPFLKFFGKKHLPKEWSKTGCVPKSGIIYKSEGGKKFVKWNEIDLFL